MASHLNIGTNQDDASFRYKMPVLALDTQQKKSTIITNLGDVAKALGVDPIWLVKYFTYHFGVPVTYAKGHATFKGSRTAADLSMCLGEFIQQFVVCPTCNLPEIDWCAKPRHDQVEIDCRACGHHTVLSSQKNKKIFDKMVGYICTEAEKVTKKSVKKVTNEVINEVINEVMEEPHYGIDDGKWSDEM
jgi:translation initiation factor 5